MKKTKIIVVVGPTASGKTSLGIHLAQNFNGEVVSGDSMQIYKGMDIATANNTVAIVMANPIASEMAKDFDISPRKTASILDTFSCIFQGILPYGAQILVALSVVNTLGYEMTAFQVISNLFYPMMLLVSSLIFIFLIPEKKQKNAD